MPLREGFQGLHGRIDVGPLRVVVIGDAVDGPHFFQAVFDAFESLEDLADDVEGRSGSIGQENRSQAILDIMLAEEVQVRFGTDDGILAMEAQDKLSVPIKAPSGTSPHVEK